MAIPAEENLSIRRNRFDPNEQRRTCEDFLVGFLSGAQRNEQSPMGMVAGSQVNAFVYCNLVGLGLKVLPLISSRIEWLDSALRESKFPAETSVFQRASMLNAKAVYHWLEGENELAHTAWAQARIEHELHMLDPSAPHAELTASTYDLDDQMALCLLAGEYDRGVSTYQRIKPGSKPTATRAQAPRDWGYLACLNRLNPMLADGELLQSGRRMLRRWLDDPWLGRGQASRAAIWLIAVHWLPNEKLTPAQTLFKAYDDLPLVDRPSFAVER